MWLLYASRSHNCMSPIITSLLRPTRYVALPSKSTSFSARSECKHNKCGPPNGLNYIYIQGMLTYIVKLLRNIYPNAHAGHQPYCKNYITRLDTIKKLRNSTVLRNKPLP